jgi:uncharacterized repeat protein (TIGR01451 family)
LNLWTAANLRPLADLAVGLSSTPASLLAGGAITNTIWVTNLGPESATGVLLTNTLSSGQVLTTNIGSLDVGAAVRTVWVVVPAGGGYITNTASIGGNEADLNEGNNSATTYLTVSSAFPAVLTGAFVNGEFRLNITCQPNFVYAIEVSTNLTSWVPVSTNTASAGGVIKYTDTASPGFTDRFYRTRCLTP